MAVASAPAAADNNDELLIIIELLISGGQRTDAALEKEIGCLVGCFE